MQMILQCHNKDTTPKVTADISCKKNLKPSFTYLDSSSMLVAMETNK